MTAPIAIVGLEDAMSAWLTSATDATPYLVDTLASGAPEPPPPSAQISMGALVAIAQPQVIVVPSIMQQRYTVTLAGAGTIGVGFELGFSPTSTTIAAVVGAGSTIPDSAAALLAELTSDLPAGVTAIADPLDTASVIVTGSASEPLFASGPVDGAFLTVTTLVERYPELEATATTMTWSVTFRAALTNGFGTAGDLLARASGSMKRKLYPATRALGWRANGILLQLPSVPTDRDGSRAQLDFSLYGFATAAYQDPTTRRAGFEVAAA